MGAVITQGKKFAIHIENANRPTTDIHNFAAARWYFSGGGNDVFGHEDFPFSDRRWETGNSIRHKDRIEQVGRTRFEKSKRPLSPSIEADCNSAVA
jgi:hypothetical protein